jgi:hypothetical protein|tara:strand:+ start:315 stop:590 length:276 start_codon:yes stop_codon:yes gene_type:complete
LIDWTQATNGTLADNSTIAAYVVAKNNSMGTYVVAKNNSLATWVLAVYPFDSGSVRLREPTLPVLFVLVYFSFHFDQQFLALLNDQLHRTK